MTFVFTQTLLLFLIEREVLSQKLWFNSNTVLQDFIIVLSSIMEYAEKRSRMFVQKLV